MIKALSGKTIILGLSEMNISKLQEGYPINFNLKDIGLDDREVVIFVGKDEETMAKYLTGSSIQ